MENSKDPQSVIQALALLTAAYNKELPRETLELYVNMLQHHDRNLLLSAVQRIVALNKFFPTIAELNEAVAYVSDPFPAPDLDIAWQEVLTTARQEGRTHRPKWSHPAIGLALDMIGGLRYVCDSPTMYEAMTAKAFKEAYQNVIKINIEEHAGLTETISMKALENS